MKISTQCNLLLFKAGGQKKQVLTDNEPQSIQPDFKARILKSRAAGRENPNHIQLSTSFLDCHILVSFLLLL